MLRESVADAGSFAQELRDWLTQSTNSGVRFLWITNPNQPSAQWKTSAIPFTNDENSSTSGKISAAANILFRNLALVLPQGSKVTWDETGKCFQLSSAGLASPQICLQVAGTAQALSLASAVNLPFYGQPGAACLRFTLNTDESALETLDVGLRYFMENAKQTDALTSLRYPIFNNQATPITLNANLNPCCHLDPKKTYFAFGKTKSSTSISSYFCTTLGYKLSLTPQSDAALVFAVKPAGNRPQDDAPFYLVPKGLFAISVNRSGGAATTPDKLMLGLSGSEYVSLVNGKTALLQFIPDRDAYAPGFHSRTASETTAETHPLAPRLTGLAKTSWTYLLGSELNYFAQPQGAEYHQAQGASEFLTLMEIPSGSFPLVENSPALSAQFPLVPYLGIQDSLHLYRDFELRVLGPERRSCIFKLNAASQQEGLRSSTSPPSPAPATGAVAAASSGLTPQGFLAVFGNALDGTDSPDWQTLTLAQDVTGQTLALTDLGGALKSALQTNQQFLVISNPSLLTQHFPQNQVNIAGWTFDLDPGTWADHQTVLLFKFYSNKSVTDCVNDLNTWTQADSFNTSPTATQQAIQAILSDAGNKQSGGDANYDDFVSTVVDENWNGILALNCTVPLTSLPPQLEGLAAGIDPTKFYAHHLGVDVTPSTSSPAGQPQMGPSSFFGLIDYSVPVNLTTTDDYSFEVDTLVLLLENSTIKNFSSTIDLLANQFFGEPCTLMTAGQSGPTPAEANIITLQGQYESHDGQPSYTFTSSGPSVFEMQSATLKAVEIVRAQYITLAPNTGYQSPQPVQSSFLFQGNLSFNPIEDLDLFSYDSLPYANLAVDITFDPRYPATPPVYAFNADRMSVSAMGSVARGASLADQFPLQVAGFVSSAGQSPRSLGYLGVEMPSEFAGLSSDWYAVQFDLNLGSLGALSSQKSFTASLLAAWSPSGASITGNSRYPAAAEIKLPFSDSSQQQFTIEDVLKLSLKAVELYPQDDAYLFKFRDIALKLLGISLPPGGNTDLYLFGNPGTKASSLAWYAAYVKKEKKRRKL